MQGQILSRELGESPAHRLNLFLTSKLIRSFAPAPQHRFNGERASTSLVEDRPHSLRAHAAGVSSLALDKFDGRLLLSGGADGSIKLWDLHSCGNPHDVHSFEPAGSIGRAPRDVKGIGHSHGVTYLGFYPFDPDAFLSSSYDKTLKLWSTRTAKLSAEFDLNTTIYSHAMSPIAEHLLVACATQHNNVRLVDLKSGAAVQALVAHGGPVLSVAWSPRHEHMLASGHADGKVRIWDVRKSGGVVAMLDQDDTEGVIQKYGNARDRGQDLAQATRSNPSARAHDEAVNGVQWTDDGAHIVTAGLDRRVRVWDAASGANTLASFGSMIQNSRAETARYFLLPTTLTAEQGLLCWANDHEMLMFDLHEGDLVSRLRSPGMSNPAGPRTPGARKNRITSVAWRGAGGGGRQMGALMGGGNSVGGIYSAHQDGQICAWMPKIPGADEEEGTETDEEEEESRTRKRKAVSDAYRSLMGKSVTFT